MNRITKSVVALTLSVGLAFTGFGWGGFKAMTVNGVGCCSDAI